jgi:hypothetical protein
LTETRGEIRREFGHLLKFGNSDGKIALLLCREAGLRVLRDLRRYRLQCQTRP